MGYPNRGVGRQASAATLAKVECKFGASDTWCHIGVKVFKHVKRAPGPR